MEMHFAKVVMSGVMPRYSCTPPTAARNPQETSSKIRMAPFACASSLSFWATALAAFGIVIAAGYILWMLQRSFFGPQTERFQDIKDATAMEMVPVAVLVIAILVVGVYPAFISDVFTGGVGEIVSLFDGAVAATAP